MSPPLTCTFWLYGLQSAINVGQCLRAAEVFKQRIAIYDAGKILVDHEKIRTISDFACGALQRVPPIDTGPTPCFMPHQRLVATCLDDDAVRLPDFVFQPDDVIVIGNEYDGVPPHIIQQSHAKLYIPLPAQILPKPLSHSPIDIQRTEHVQHHGMPSLNAAMVVNIISYCLYAQPMRAT